MPGSKVALSPDWHIDTPRLRISHFLPTEQYAEFLVALYNTPLFIAGEGDTGINTTEKGLDAITNGFIGSHFSKNGHGPYVLSLRNGESPKQMIGSVSLMKGQYTEPDIGFALLPEYTGKGYANEAGRAIMEYATRSKESGGLGYNGVFGFTGAKNAKSRRVCESLGLEFRGVYPLTGFDGARSAVFTMPGMREDVVKYGITEERLDEP